MSKTTKLKFFILRLVDPDYSTPRNPYSDSYSGMVVCAASEERARQMASDSEHNKYNKAIWLDPALSRCEDLAVDDGEEWIVMQED